MTNPFVKYSLACMCVICLPEVGDLVQNWKTKSKFVRNYEKIENVFFVFCVFIFEQFN